MSKVDAPHRRLHKRLVAMVKERLRRKFAATTPDDVLVSGKGGLLLLSEERKWLKASYEKEIGIDRDTHRRTGLRHVHFHDRKGNEVYAMTHDCRPSHGSKPFRLSKKQSEILSGEGFPIPKNRMVEAVLLGNSRLLLLG